jgi:hypothetical protein
MKKKKPDNIVYDHESESYNASILPYSTSVGAPSIQIEDNKSWKERGVAKVNKKIKTRFNELKQEYDKLIDEFKWNDLIYNSKFSFEPVIGETYYLYLNNSNDHFLSLISPESWNKECIGKFVLNSEGRWIKSI